MTISYIANLFRVDFSHSEKAKAKIKAAADRKRLDVISKTGNPGCRKARAERKRAVEEALRLAVWSDSDLAIPEQPRSA